MTHNVLNRFSFTGVILTYGIYQGIQDGVVMYKGSDENYLNIHHLKDSILKYIKLGIKL